MIVQLVLMAAGAVVLLWLAGWLYGAFRADPPPAAHPAPADLVELAEGRLGQQVQAICPWTHQHAIGANGKPWNGEQPLWIALTDQDLWLLYREQKARIGGVHSRLPRTGLHPVWRRRRLAGNHIGELCWPDRPWFCRGELDGPVEQRLRLIGLLAADQLTLRREVSRAR